MRVLLLPFAQGRNHACAPLCIAVGAMLLVNEAALHGCFVDEALMRRAFDRGMTWWRFMIERRRHEHPEDTSNEFSVDATISDIVKKRPTEFAIRATGGFLVTRARVDGNSERGCLPRFLDELDAVHRSMQTTRVPHSLILTCDGYTRLIHLRMSGVWLYDSHGIENSSLYVCDSVEEVLVLVLQLYGMDDACIAENVAQLHEPARRVPDVEYDVTAPPARAYELSIMSLPVTRV